MAAERIPFISPAEYLERERQAEFKSEYVSGQMWMMAGASPNHNRITRNLLTSLWNQLRRSGCEPFSSDVRVRADAARYFYPDVTVVCGKAEWADTHLDTLTNPTVIFEVLSDSTQGFDRGEKAIAYRRIESLQTLIFLSQSALRAEVWERQATGDGWLVTDVDGADGVLALPLLQIAVLLSEVYERVEFVE